LDAFNLLFVKAMVPVAEQAEYIVLQ